LDAQNMIDQKFEAAVGMSRSGMQERLGEK